MAIRCLYYTHKKLRNVAIRCSHNTCYKLRLRSVYLTIIFSHNTRYKLRSVYTTIRCLHNTRYKLRGVYTTIRCLHNEHGKLSLYMTIISVSFARCVYRYRQLIPYIFYVMYILFVQLYQYSYIRVTHLSMQVCNKV